MLKTTQGARTFADLLQGYRDFLALCEKHHWTLNATKTKVGYPSCVFFGFEVDLHGTRLADNNLDPVRRMVPPTNLPELQSTLSLFVQSSRFIPRYSHIVTPLTAFCQRQACTFHLERHYTKRIWPCEELTARWHPPLPR
jgi:hypothetical protein